MVTGSVTKLGTDTVASSGGWSPVIHLAGHCGSRPVWNEEILGFLAGPTVESASQQVLQMENTQPPVRLPRALKLPRQPLKHLINLSLTLSFLPQKRVRRMQR